MIPINLRYNRKSCPSLPYPVRDSAKFSSEVGHNFPKEKFHNQVICNSRNCFKKIIFMTKRYSKYG